MPKALTTAQALTHTVQGIHSHSHLSGWLCFYCLHCWFTSLFARRNIDCERKLLILSFITSPCFRANPCPSVVGISPTEKHLSAVMDWPLNSTDLHWTKDIYISCFRANPCSSVVNNISRLAPKGYWFGRKLLILSLITSPCFRVHPCSSVVNNIPRLAPKGYWFGRKLSILSLITSPCFRAVPCNSVVCPYPLALAVLLRAQLLLIYVV